jgi:hypothetical protein
MIMRTMLAGVAPKAIRNPELSKGQTDNVRNDRVQATRLSAERAGVIGEFLDLSAGAIGSFARFRGLAGRAEQVRKRVSVQV